MAQETAMADETGAQIRSTFDLDARLATVPNVKKPVNTHIPVAPVGSHSKLIRSAEASK
jgi:hypothetical protein